MSLTSIYPQNTAFDLFFNQVKHECCQLALSRNLDDLDSGRTHIFVQQPGSPIQKGHFLVAVRPNLASADFLAVTVVGQNVLTRQRWLACMGQDATGGRQCFCLELVNVEGREWARGPRVIEEDTMDEADAIIHLAAELRLEQALALIGTGKEASDVH